MATQALLLNRLSQHRVLGAACVKLPVHSVNDNRNQNILLAEGFSPKASLV